MGGGGGGMGRATFSPYQALKSHSGSTKAFVHARGPSLIVAHAERDALCDGPCLALSGLSFGGFRSTRPFTVVILTLPSLFYLLNISDNCKLVHMHSAFPERSH